MYLDIIFGCTPKATSYMKQRINPTGMHWILSKEHATGVIADVLIQNIYQSKAFLNAECKESF